MDLHVNHLRHKHHGRQALSLMPALMALPLALPSLSPLLLASLLASLLVGAGLSGCGSDGDETGSPQDAQRADGGSDGVALDGTTLDGADGATTDTNIPVELGPPRTLKFCAGGTQQRYDPLKNPSLDLFPDDLWARPDLSTLTGIRLDVNAKTPWIASLSDSFAATLADLSRLDGWGTTASLFIRFEGPLGELPNGEDASMKAESVQLWQLEPTPARLPFEATTIDDGHTMVLSPMIPLRPKTKHLLVVTRAQLGESGDCLAPATVTQAMLERTVVPERLRARVPALEDALKASKIKPEDVSAISVFTTQSIIEESVAVAEDIAKRAYTWSQKVTCTTPKNKPYRLCEGRFVGQDYRKDREVQPTGQAPLEHRVRLWLPKQNKGVKAAEAAPVILFGHGLTGAKDQGEPVGVFAAPMNVAVVAIDAVQHGTHPAGGAAGLAAVLKFFGIDAATLSFDFLALRDNWRQSTFDRLQLLRLIAQQPDVDGDGTADLDPKQIAYLGVSLGGIMGPELLALTDAIGAAVLSVPGGKVSSIIQSSTEFGPLIVAFKPEGTSDGDVARFFPILQTLVERGDAANWGRHVLTERLKLASGGTPSVLLQMALHDEIVPNVATRALVRGMGVPQVGPTLQDVGIVAEGLKLPLAGNFNGGKTTAGLFQFDWVRKKAGGALKAASHGSVPASHEALTQDKAFIQTWLAGKPPQIVHP